MDAIDPTRCPLCLEPNTCAMEIAKTTHAAPERCWCLDAVFSSELMDKVPEQAKGKACICANCAAASHTL